MNVHNAIIGADDTILVTGANGFIGNRVVRAFIDAGFQKIRCLVRSTHGLDNYLDASAYPAVEIIKGNLLSKDDCERAVGNAAIIVHLAAGVGKAFPTCVMNSVVTTRNLLEAAAKTGTLKRFVNISSFAVYDPSGIRRGGLLDETCPVIENPVARGEAYCYGKVKQDQIVMDYGRTHGIPYVILRPGAVFGPGKNAVSGRVGIDTFGIYLHMGGNNQMPFVYVDNCAEAIVLAALRSGIDREIFNIVDDDLPSSADFLSQYKKEVKQFRTINIHHRVSYILCWMWQAYAKWSEGQLPPAFNTSRWSAEWKGHRYSNAKLKNQTGWEPRVPMKVALKQYFDYSKTAGGIQ